MKFLRNLRWWWEEHQAKKNSKENLLALAERRRSLAAALQKDEGPSATGAFATVKKAIDDATEETRKAKESAVRISDSLPKR